MLLSWLEQDRKRVHSSLPQGSAVLNGCIFGSMFPARNPRLVPVQKPWELLSPCDHVTHHTYGKREPVQVLEPLTHFPGGDDLCSALLMLQSENTMLLQRWQWGPLPTDPSSAVAPAGHSDVSQA